MIEILVTFHPYTKNTVKWRCEVSSDGYTFIIFDNFLVYAQLSSLNVTMDIQENGRILFEGHPEEILPDAKKTVKKFVNTLCEFVKEYKEAYKESYVLPIGD